MSAFEDKLLSYNPTLLLPCGDTGPTTIDDVSTNDNDATAVGSPTFGEAGIDDNTTAITTTDDDYIDFSSNSAVTAALDGATEATWLIAMKPTEAWDSGTDTQTIIDMHDSSDGVSIEYDSGGIKVTADSDSDSYTTDLAAEYALWGFDYDVISIDFAVSDYASIQYDIDTDTSITSSSGFIDDVDNLISDDRNIQSLLTGRSGYATNVSALNDRDAALFDGVNDYMDIVDTRDGETYAALTGTEDDYYMFFVVRPTTLNTTGDTNHIIYAQYVSTDADRFLLFFTFSGGKHYLAVLDGAIGGLSAGATEININTTYVISVIRDWGDSTLKVYLNGVLEIDIASTNAMAEVDGAVGYSRDLSFGYFAGYFCEAASLPSTTVMTDELREMFEGYYAGKWASTSILDAGHAYYSGFSLSEGQISIYKNGALVDTLTGFPSTLTMPSGEEYTIKPNATVGHAAIFGSALGADAHLDIYNYINYVAPVAGLDWFTVIGFSNILELPGVVITASSTKANTSTDNLFNDATFNYWESDE